MSCIIQLPGEDILEVLVEKKGEKNFFIAKFHDAEDNIKPLIVHKLEVTWSHEEPTGWSKDSREFNKEAKEKVALMKASGYEKKTPRSHPFKNSLLRLLERVV